MKNKTTTDILASLTLAMPERRANEEDPAPLAALIVDGASRITKAVAKSALSLSVGLPGPAKPGS